MRFDKKWMKTAATLLIGMIMGIGVCHLHDRWTRPAEAASIDDLARGTLGTLLQAVPIPRGEKIKGVTGLGDGQTFIVYSDDYIRFYQFVNPALRR